MLDKHVALLEKKVKSAYHISSSTQWFLIQNSGSFANTWAYPRNVCYILEMLIFQHRNDAVRSQVVHLCCSNCRAFVASSQQLDFCQELDAWDLHTGPDHYCLLFPRETCPCRVVISEGPGELQFAVYMHATKDYSRFFNPWNRLHGTGQNDMWRPWNWIPWLWNSWAGWFHMHLGISCFFYHCRLCWNLDRLPIASFVHVLD